MDLALLAEKLGTHQTEVKAALNGTKEKVNGLAASVDDLHQKMARRGGGDYLGGSENKTWGSIVTESDELPNFVRKGARGMMRVEVKTITSASSSGGALISPDRQREVVTGPRRHMTIRALLSPGETTSNSIEFMREKVFTNAASVVAETTQKPESNITYELVSTPVRTIAHWVPVSRQAMDDAPLLRSLIDGALRFGLSYEEELQILLGAGTGENLHGLIPQATDYDTDADLAGDTMADTILHAISQGEVESQLPMTGIVVNSTDWSTMVGLKDADGRYLGGGPFGSTAQMLWQRPVVDTPAMPQGQFLVLNGTQAAQIFDRMEAEVLISSEHADFFTRNLLAVRGESRLALVVKRKQALVHGSYPTAP